MSRAPRRTAHAALVLGALMSPATVLHAQTITVPNGMPQGPIPTFEEVGIGGFTLPTSGSTRTIGSDGSTVRTSTAPSAATGSDALEKMYGSSWGYQAAQNAETVGVNPSALAATCVVESGCRNLYTANGKTTITGAFQMSNGTYTEQLNRALAQHPELADTITSGIAGQQDPATQAVAAAQYLKQAATSLQSAGVDNPTPVDTRGYYNFGPKAGISMARASSDTPMSEFISADKMAKNGVTPNETVGQWRSAVAGKMGSAATQSVLLTH
ncbi:hypothetical protein GOB87_15740 [Acetobacter estunensis]|uniref:Uncharacterized protein n=2 Tax=Acetobacter estunensis TaxID=104097 RepID=A0A967BF34_9PROT|nr:hypothetical protein [Acetobacter estunensis]